MASSPIGPVFRPSAPEWPRHSARGVHSLYMYVVCGTYH